MDEKFKIKTFDDAVIFNRIDKGKLTKYGNFNSWSCLLRDVAVSLYEWHGNLSFHDLLMIEEFIFNREEFALVRCKYKINQKVNVKTDIFHIFRCSPIGEIIDGQPKAIRIYGDHLSENLRKLYKSSEFVYFNNRTFSYPWQICCKYAEMLTKLDALYMQNVEKLSLPVMAINNKSTHNEMLNYFKRGEINAVFSVYNPTQMQQNSDTTKIFFNPQIEFLLDKINKERDSIMKEYLLELGVNTNLPSEKSKQYVNIDTVKESSQVSRFFSASLNKYRRNFRDQINRKFPSLAMSFQAYAADELDSLLVKENLDDKTQIK